MRVLHIGEYVKGGIATYINELVSYQSKQSDIEEIYLLMSKNNSEENISLNDKNIFYYDYIRKPVYFFKAIKEINSKIKEIKPDIIHVHSTFAGLFVRFPLFFKHKSFKVVYCSHGWAFLIDTSGFKKKIYSIIERMLSFRTDLIINISTHEYNNSLDYGIPKEKSITIFNGISENQNMDNNKVDISLDKSMINLLFIGRFDRQKGLDILIDYYNTYKNKKVKIYTIGREILQDQPIKIPRNIIQLGWIDNQFLDAYYKLFDAVIIPSRWEGFGLVAVEAMKNKRAVIASNRGALPELIIDGYNGHVFSLEKLDTLNELLSKLNKNDLEVMGVNGYNRFKSNYTSQVMNQKILVEYKKLIMK